MNNTKWDEVRQAMFELGEFRPKWRTMDITGYLSEREGDWFYHFRSGGYSSIEWAEFLITSPDHGEVVLASLREVRVPGEKVEHGFRIYGYGRPGLSLNYL